ncbi:MAG: carbohydrate ABC transporter permease, partial [Erysipelotrichaceae bacterium]|nr:carbohydrate ABC transporter permease [Erysipelotrichaceae bacterium]
MKKIKFGTIARYTLLAIGGIIMIFPFIWMLISSLKTWAECGSMPPTWWPKDPTFENYVYAFKTAPFLKYFRNSLIVTVVCTSITMINTILCAFTFSRLKFPGRDLIFSIMVSLMMIPYEMLIITNYTTIVKLKLYDTLA